MTLSITVLNTFMLSDIILNAVMLSVMAPLFTLSDISNVL
jgi:hypothetical protein